MHIQFFKRDQKDFLFKYRLRKIPYDPNCFIILIYFVCFIYLFNVTLPFAQNVLFKFDNCIYLKNKMLFLPLSMVQFIYQVIQSRC